MHGVQSKKCNVVPHLLTLAVDVWQLTFYDSRGLSRIGACHVGGWHVMPQLWLPGQPDVQHGMALAVFA